MKKVSLLGMLLMTMTLGHAQNLQLNDREYFERQGVNVLVFSNSFNGGFFIHLVKCRVTGRKMAFYLS
jgi:hypothetical protein